MKGITCFMFFISFYIISCVDMENMEDFELSELEDCDYIDENINNFDLFEGFLTLTLNHAYVPDIDKRDSLMNDYHYLKFRNEKINGTYIITDANVRYKVNRVEPYDSISQNEYPFSTNILNENVCIFLDLQKSEGCDCN